MGDTGNTALLAPVAHAWKRAQSDRYAAFVAADVDASTAAHTPVQSHRIQIGVGIDYVDQNPVIGTARGGDAGFGPGGAGRNRRGDHHRRLLVGASIFALTHAGQRTGLALATTVNGPQCRISSASNPTADSSHHSRRSLTPQMLPSRSATTVPSAYQMNVVYGTMLLQPRLRFALLIFLAGPAG